MIRGRLDEDISRIFRHRFAGIGDALPDFRHELFESAAFFYLRPDGVQHHLRIVQRVDIGDVVSDSGNDKFPARRHDIAARVLQFVAHFHERGNHHVVVGILRETKPLFGEKGAVIVRFKRRVLIDADVYFRIDQIQRQGSVKADLAEFVIHFLSVFARAAEDEALPVVPLLHAGIEVGVEIQIYEKLARKFQRLFPVEFSAVHVLFEKGIHIDVEAPERIVLVAVEPQDEIEKAEHHQRFVIALRSFRGDVCKRLGKLGYPHPAGFFAVFFRHQLHGVDAHVHRFQLFAFFFVPGKFFHLPPDLFPLFLKALR